MSNRNVAVLLLGVTIFLLLADTTPRAAVAVEQPSGRTMDFPAARHG